MKNDKFDNYFIEIKHFIEQMNSFLCFIQRWDDFNTSKLKVDKQIMTFHLNLMDDGWNGFNGII